MADTVRLERGGVTLTVDEDTAVEMRKLGFTDVKQPKRSTNTDKS